MCVSPTAGQLVELANGLAAEAARRGDPAFGAVLVSPHGEVLVMESNREVSTGDPTAHAEMLLLRDATTAGIAHPLRGYTVAVNAEPCPMCATALAGAGVGRAIFSDPKGEIGVLDLGSNAGSKAGSGPGSGPPR